jgi:anti-sigma B factor antagonist
MELLEKTYSDRHVISIVGELKALTCPQLERRLEDLIVSGQHVIIIDCSRMTLISSAGLRVFYEYGGKLEKTGGRLLLAEPSANVRTIFDLVEIGGDFPILPTLVDALALKV